MTNHVALVCSDMAATVVLYEGVLGSPCSRPSRWLWAGARHFFFDIGNSASLAFMWFLDAEPAASGIDKQPFPHAPPLGRRLDEPRRHRRPARSASTSTTEAAGAWPRDAPDQPRRQPLRRQPKGASRHLDPLYFWDPDGIRLEFAAYCRAMTAADVAHQPVDATGRHRDLTPIT